MNSMCLTIVIEAAGMPFLEFMKKNVFIPAKMYDTYPDTHEKICAGRPRYYQRNEKGVLINSPYVDNSNKWAGGGFVSTCEVSRFRNISMTLMSGHCSVWKCNGEWNIFEAFNSSNVVDITHD
jgi:CubicO group peptidase (beta-lactamase class C family)